MSFTLFDSELLKSISKKIKLKSFSLYSFTILCEANHIYDKFPLQYIGLSGKSIDSHKQKLVNDIRQNNSAAFRKHLKKYSDDCKQHQQLKTYDSLRDLLNSSIWQTWIVDKPKAVDKLTALNKFWLNNKMTSHLTHEALHAAATIVIPLFENFHYFASEEINAYKKKLGNKIYVGASNYLKQLEEEINLEKNKIVEAMLARLEIASVKNDLHETDLNCYLLDELKKMEIAGGISTIKKRPLLEPLFSYFHQYIFKAGNQLQQRRLRELVWLKDDKDYSLQLTDDSWVIVPRSIEIETLNSYRFFQFFNIKQFPINFLKDNFWFLASLRTICGIKNFHISGVSGPAEREQWDKLIQLDKACFQQTLSANRFLSSWWRRILLANRYHFYSGWNKFTLTASNQLLEKKIKFAHNISEQLKTRMLFNLDKELISCPRTKSFLLSIVTNIDSSYQAFARRPDEQWLNVKFLLLQAAQNIGSESASYVHDFEVSQQKLSTTKISESLVVKGINVEKPLDALDAILVSLTHENRFCINNKNFLNDLAWLEKQLIKYNASLLLSELSAFWQKFLACYIQTCLSTTDMNEYLSVISKILLTFSPPYIQEKIQFLERNEMQNMFIYQVRCKALLYSLEAKQIMVSDSNESNQVVYKGVMNGY